MGMYMYVSEQDRIDKRKVLDILINEAFQEALKYDPSLMIEEHKKVVKKGWFKKETISTFQLYYECPAHDGSAYQARYQNSGSGESKITLAYLHGVINGYLAYKPKK